MSPLDVTQPLPPRASIEEEAALLQERYGALSGEALLKPMLRDELKGRVAIVSSFGAESAVLLHMTAAVDPSVPVIFIDTGKLFGETLRYRDQLIQLLGLEDVRVVGPAKQTEASRDRAGNLWARDPGACCQFRKVEPLRKALAGFPTWISGRKRYQGGERAQLPAIELADGKIKLNPLASWSRPQIQAEFDARKLPRHPLEADGFLSIGCMPCTDRVASGEDVRAGRWRGMVKTECGIHQRWSDGPAPAKR
jgi:phosphoadenosine phosphosulfate reductase